jgi:hypothetical protein
MLCSAASGGLLSTKADCLDDVASIREGNAGKPGSPGDEVGGEESGESAGEWRPESSRQHSSISILLQRTMHTAVDPATVSERQEQRRILGKKQRRARREAGSGACGYGLISGPISSYKR